MHSCEEKEFQMSALDGISSSWDSLADKYTYFPKVETVKLGLKITAIALGALVLLSLPVVGIVVGVKALS